jgi:hypothetical protein
LIQLLKFFFFADFCDSALICTKLTLVSGHLLPSRGALFPALQASGLSEAEVRRAWAAFRGGVWQIGVLLPLWRGYIEGLPGWHYHEHEGYRAVPVDITAFFRPQLKDCPSKHYYAPAGKALPAIIIGMTGTTGSLNGQRLAVPRDFLRVTPKDPSEKSLQVNLIKQVYKKLAEDEAAVMDAGFKLRAVQEAGLKRYVLRLSKNFTARRNKVMPYTGTGRYPVYGEWVRPLARTYDGNEIAATAPDKVVTWKEDGHEIRAEIWADLILPGVVPGPDNPTFQVVAVYDPRYNEPWLLATDLPIEPVTVKALYHDRWPIEQIPLSAKQIVGAHRQFVFSQESIQRLPELALLAGSIQSFLAASMPVMPTGFWDRKPRRTPGRLRRALFGQLFPSCFSLPERIRKKNSVTDHLPKGILGHRRKPVQESS